MPASIHLFPAYDNQLTQRKFVLYSSCQAARFNHGWDRTHASLVPAVAGESTLPTRQHQSGRPTAKALIAAGIKCM
jgi:hypothetical protein